MGRREYEGKGWQEEKWKKESKKGKWEKRWEKMGWIEAIVGTNMLLKIRPDWSVRLPFGHGSGLIRWIDPERGWTNGPIDEPDEPIDSLQTG